MPIQDKNLTAGVRFERQVMDRIPDHLRSGGLPPLRHLFYGHFRQSWHQEIEGVRYNIIDIMELRELHCEPQDDL